MDKRLESIKDLEFNFNEEMKELIFDMLAMQQMLNNEEYAELYTEKPLYFLFILQENHLGTNLCSQDFCWRCFTAVVPFF